LIFYAESAFCCGAILSLCDAQADSLAWEYLSLLKDYQASLSTKGFTEWRPQKGIA